VLHGDESEAILFAYVINGGDVGVVQGGSGLGFTQAGENLRIAGNLVRQKLERDKAMQARIFRFVDYTYPTASQPFEDAVMRNGLADHWAQILGAAGMAGQCRRRTRVAETCAGRNCLVQTQGKINKARVLVEREHWVATRGRATPRPHRESIMASSHYLISAASAGQ
jgi:hypothetical protein